MNLLIIDEKNGKLILNSVQDNSRHTATRNYLKQTHGFHGLFYLYML